jgi:hypothetical protein
MSFFSSTPAKIVYAILLGVVIYYGAVQRMASSRPKMIAPPSTEK